MFQKIKSLIILTVVSVALLMNCSNRESALIEIDFANAEQWRYMLGIDIYGEPTAAAGASSERFSGTLRAFVQGLPYEGNERILRARLTDINLVAPFMSESEREDVLNRLSALVVSVTDEGVALSDTAPGLPGVFSGAWDILRSPARVIPAMPNAQMTVGSSWEREQRFPLTIDDSYADGLLYQLYTLDSLQKTDAGETFAHLSWTFTYRVAVAPSGGQRRYPLAGSGRGTATLDVDQKKLVKSRAVFQVTHSGMGNSDINEVVHFEVVE